MSEATGRPSKYTDEIADEICDELSKGVSLRRICEAEHLPSARTVWRWLRENDSFCQQYARAKEECADYLVEELLEIADDGSNDWMEKLDQDGNAYGFQLNGEHVQRSRLRIDTRKWIASKLKAKKYGERIEAPTEPVKHIFLFEDADDTAQG